MIGKQHLWLWPLAGIVALGAGACSGDESGLEERLVQRDSAGVELFQNRATADEVDEVVVQEPILTIGSAEGAEEDLLSRVGGATRLQGGLVALTDNGSSTVRIYDRSGKLLSSFGGRGEGPREFMGVVGPWEVDAGDARLAAYDARGQRLAALTADASFVDVHPLRPRSAAPPRVAGVLDDLTVVQVERDWEGRRGEFSPTTAHVVAIGPPRWSRDTIYSAVTNRRGFITTESGREVMAGPIFEPSFSSAAGDGTIVVSDCAEPEYRMLDARGEVVRIVRWTSKDRSVSEDDVKSFYEEMTSSLSPDRRRAVEERLDASPVQEVFPACDVAHPLLGDALRVSRDGDIWVREFIRPTDPEQTWLRFEDGVLQSTLRLGKSVSVQEFGADYVLVIERDELDVERLREYELSHSNR